MKFVFFGSDEIGLKVLQFLEEKNLLAGVVSNADKKAGRGKKLLANPIAAYARQKGIALICPEKKPDDEEIAWLKQVGATGAIVMAYGFLLTQKFLDSLNGNFFNLHTSKLPLYRGASPIETAIACGEKKTGVSLMKIILKMDAGGVCDFKEVEISSDDTGGSLREKLSLVAAQIIEENIFDISNKSFKTQDEEEASYCRKITKQDGQIDFFQHAKVIELRERAFRQKVGSFFIHNNTPIKVMNSSVVELEHGKDPATVLKADENGLLVACSIGAICFKNLQRPCQKMLPAKEFFNGYTIKENELLESVAELLALIHY